MHGFVLLFFENHNQAGINLTTQKDNNRLPKPVVITSTTSIAYPNTSPPHA
jgi:hypothetical protein